MARAGSVASIDFSKRDRVQAGPTSVTVVSRGGTSASGDPRSRSVLAISQPDDVGANDPERQRFQSFDSSRCTCVFLVARDIDRAERCRCQCQCQCVDSVYLVCARGGWVDGSCGWGGCMRGSIGIDGVVCIVDIFARCSVATTTRRPHTHTQPRRRRDHVLTYRARHTWHTTTPIFLSWAWSVACVRACTQ